MSEKVALIKGIREIDEAYLAEFKNLVKIMMEVDLKRVVKEKNESVH